MRGDFMKKFVVILITLFSLPAFGVDIEVTIHVDGDYRPFSFSDKGKAKGMYIDVLRTVFSRMKGFNVKMEPVPWKRGKMIMKSGTGFGLAPAFFHGHDWPYLYPYSVPFYHEIIISVCQEKVLKSLRPNWPQDYIGLKIGNVAGFDGWGGVEFRKLVEQGKINYEEARGSKENILKLASGRLDCVMMEDKAFDYVFEQLKKSERYQEGRNVALKKGAVIGPDPVSIGYSKPAIEAGKYSFKSEFMKSFDSEIYKMIKAGEIERIMDAYQD